MAYVPQQLPDNEQNLFAPKSPTTANPIPPQTGGSSGTSAQPSSAPGVGTSTQFGSNAAKLSDYLSANAPQIEAQGQKISDSLSQGYDQTVGNIDQAVGDFGKQVSSSYTPPNTELVNRAATNPSEFVKNSDDVASFRGQYGDSYSGPNNFESSQPYADINGQVNKAVQNASLVKTPAGLGTYLGTNFGANETPGMQTLDTALLAGNPKATTNIQNAAKPYDNLNGYLTTQTKNADTGIANAKQAATDNATAVQNQFTGPNGVIPSFRASFNENLGTARTNAKNSADTAMADFLAGSATPADLQAIGIDPNTYKGFASDVGALNKDYGINTDLNQFLSANSPDSITSSNFATNADYDKADALALLTGQDMSGFLNPSNSGEAGTAPTSLISYQGLNGPHDALNQNDQGVLGKYADLTSGSNLDDKTTSLLTDVFGRHLDALNPSQLNWLDRGGSSIQPGPLPPSNPGTPPNAPLTSDQINSAMNQWMAKYPQPSADDPQFHNWLVERNAYLQSLGSPSDQQGQPPGQPSNQPPSQPNPPQNSDQINSAVQAWMTKHPQPSADDPQFHNWLVQRQAYLKSIGG